MKLSNCILSVGIIFISCESYPKEEYYYYDDGSLKAKVVTYNSSGKRDAYNYYPNGNLNFIHYYENYNNDGISEWYDSLGKIRSRKEISNNQANGNSRFYYPSGNLQAKSEIKDSERHGWSIVYFDKVDTIRKQLIYFHQDLRMYDLLYDEEGQIVESYLTYEIEKVSESEDSISLKFKLPFSYYRKLAIKFGNLENIQDEYRLSFDNDSIVKTTIAKDTKRKIEGLVLEVKSFSKIDDPIEDSVVAFKYAASYPFELEY